MRAAWRVLPAAVILAAGLGLRACGPHQAAPADGGLAGSQDYPSRVVVDSPELRSAKAAAGIAPCPTASENGSQLPRLTLSCLGGGPALDLSTLRGPAVINVWASWCPPCREELPLFGRLADTGNLTVLGVDWQDTQPGSALALLKASKVRYPQLADPENRLGEYFGIPGPPATVYVDRAGTVTYRGAGVVRSYAELTRLVRERTGVSVTPG